MDRIRSSTIVSRAGVSAAFGKIFLPRSLRPKKGTEDERDRIAILPADSSAPSVAISGALARASVNTVVVALAAKMARIVWALLRYGTTYETRGIGWPIYRCVVVPLTALRSDLIHRPTPGRTSRPPAGGSPGAVFFDLTRRTTRLSTKAASGQWALCNYRIHLSNKNAPALFSRGMPQTLINAERKRMGPMVCQHSSINPRVLCEDYRAHPYSLGIEAGRAEGRLIRPNRTTALPCRLGHRECHTGTVRTRQSNRC